MEAPLDREECGFVAKFARSVKSQVDVQLRTLRCSWQVSLELVEDVQSLSACAKLRMIQVHMTREFVLASLDLQKLTC